MPSLSHHAYLITPRRQGRQETLIFSVLTGKDLRVEGRRTVGPGPVNPLSGSTGCGDLRNLAEWFCLISVNCAGFRLPGLVSWSRVQKCGGLP